MTHFTNVTRKATNQLIEDIENGNFEASNVLTSLLSWLSESDVAKFVESEQYTIETNEDED